MARGRPWTKHELAILKRMYAEGAELCEIAERLHRTESSCRARIFESGFSRNDEVPIDDENVDNWTPEMEDHLVKEWVKLKTTEKIAKDFGFSVMEIQDKLRELGYEYKDTMPESYARCPFYIKMPSTRSPKKTGKPTITCEGFGGCKEITLTFDNWNNLKTYTRQYCLGYWSKCEIAEMLNRFYDKHGI